MVIWSRRNISSNDWGKIRKTKPESDFFLLEGIWPPASLNRENRGSNPGR
jgi:hypothetical protein